MLNTITNCAYRKIPKMKRPFHNMQNVSRPKENLKSLLKYYKQEFNIKKNKEMDMEITRNIFNWESY